MSSGDLNIAVLGSGVVGLTTALLLQEEYRNANVEIIAEKFLQDTTSSVAAGLFRPGTSFSGPNQTITQKWISDSFNFWNELYNSGQKRTGIGQISGYIFSSEHPHIVRNAYLENLVPVYRPASKEELKMCPGDWKYGSFFSTVVIQCSEYLPWAMQHFKGAIKTEKIEKFQQIDAKYDVVVNCTGLGAKLLCNDYKLVPIRGQVIKVRAPWIKNFFYADYDTYIIPGVDGSVTLGGCRQYDSYNLGVDKYDKASIKENCENLYPDLKKAEFIADRVGLRPHRDPVRVEKEIFDTNDGRRLKIVHNYGHGGYGVTTAPGTAMHAVKLVRDILQQRNKL